MSDPADPQRPATADDARAFLAPRRRCDSGCECPCATHARRDETADRLARTVIAQAEESQHLRELLAMSERHRDAWSKHNARLCDLLTERGVDVNDPLSREIVERRPVVRGLDSAVREALGPLWPVWQERAESAYAALARIDAACDVEPSVPELDADRVCAEVERLRADLAEATQARDEALQALDHDGRALDAIMCALRDGDYGAAVTIVQEIDDPKLCAARGVVLDRKARMIARGWAVTAIGSALVETLDALPVENLIEWKMTIPDGRELTLTAQWRHGKTAMDLVTEAKAERDAAFERGAAAMRAAIREHIDAGAGMLAANDPDNNYSMLTRAAQWVGDVPMPVDVGEAPPSPAQLPLPTGGA